MKSPGYGEAAPPRQEHAPLTATSNVQMLPNAHPDSTHSATSADWYLDTDSGLAKHLVNRTRLTWLATATEYGEQSGEWISRDADGVVTRRTDEWVATLAGHALLIRRQALDRLADIYDTAKIVAHQWVPVRRREYGDPWPDDDDEATGGALDALPPLTSGDGAGIGSTEVVAADDARTTQVVDHLATQSWITSSGALRPEPVAADGNPTAGHMATDDTEAPGTLAEVITESCRRGWWPLPVRDKRLPLAGFSGEKNPYITDDQVAAWAREWPDGYDCFAYRHQRTIAIDVDVYEKAGVRKEGADVLRQFVADKGLPPLPPTASSTKRPGSPSRQYAYRLPEWADEDLIVSNLGRDYPGVDICRKGHRYTICWPTEYPAGTLYRWYDAGPATGVVPPAWGPVREGLPPPVAEIAVLPDVWVKALSKDSRVAIDPNAIVRPTSEFLDTFDDGEPDEAVARAITAAEGAEVGHEAYGQGLAEAMRYGRDGRRGARRLVDALHRRHVEYRAASDGKIGDADTYLDWWASQVQRERQTPTLTALINRDQGPSADQWDMNDLTDERNWASTAELNHWVARFAGNRAQAQFIWRRRWLLQDDPERVLHHVTEMVRATLIQDYSARDVVAAVRQVVKATGQPDGVATEVLRAALGAAKRK